MPDDTYSLFQEIKYKISPIFLAQHIKEDGNKECITINVHDIISWNRNAYDILSVTSANPYKGGVVQYRIMSDEEEFSLYLLMRKNGIRVLRFHDKDAGEIYVNANQITGIQTPIKRLFGVASGTSVSLRFGKTLAVRDRPSIVRLKIASPCILSLLI